MRVLHLVRHAPVSVDFGVPSRQWSLRPDASARILDLARHLQDCALRRVVASPEPKAMDTGRILAEALGLRLETRVGLEEHHRLVEQQTGSIDAFTDNVRRFFDHPGEIVFGTESADTARTRFRKAVEAIMNESSDDEVIVSHGTVMTLLIAEGNGEAPIDIWSALQLPDHVALQWPSLIRIRH